MTTSTRPKNVPEPCFACGNSLQEIGRPVTTINGQGPWVGQECGCYQHVKEAAEAGYQPPKGGPRLWLVDLDPNAARTNRRRAT